MSAVAPTRSGDRRRTAGDDQTGRVVPADGEVPRLAALLRTFGPFHLTGTYGLFAVMTTTRPEVIDLHAERADFRVHRGSIHLAAVP